MKTRNLREKHIGMFREYLEREEKSDATIEKYLRDGRAFWVYAGNRPITKEVVLAYKKYLIEKDYAVRSINSMLASLNSLMGFLGWDECRTRAIKQQRQIYCAEEKELTKEEYKRLLKAAQANKKLALVIQTICSTGIRVSELRYFTVEGVEKGEIAVNCKGKMRIILLLLKLKKLLLNYAQKEKIHSGPIFFGPKRKTAEQEDDMGADESALRQGCDKIQQSVSA